MAVLILLLPVAAWACERQHHAEVQVWPPSGADIPSNGRIYAQLQGRGFKGQDIGRELVLRWGLSLVRGDAKIQLRVDWVAPFTSEVFLTPETAPAAGPWHLGTSDRIPPAEMPWVPGGEQFEGEADPEASGRVELAQLVEAVGWTFRAEPDVTAPEWTGPTEVMGFEVNSCGVELRVRVHVSEPVLLQYVIVPQFVPGGSVHQARCTWEDGACSAVLRVGGTGAVRIGAVDAAGNRLEPGDEIRLETGGRTP